MKIYSDEDTKVVRLFHGTKKLIEIRISLLVILIICIRIMPKLDYTIQLPIQIKNFW